MKTQFAPWLAFLLASCGTQPPPEQSPANDSEPFNESEPPPGHVAPDEPPPAEPVTLIAQDLVLAQWAKAANRSRCAPIGFASEGGANGKARPATFSGGWAVAFDRPGLRSAYGIAGSGLIPDDEEPAREQRLRLEKQWPHMHELPALPQPAFAGYGLEGAEPYPADNPEGKGAQSAAYVRVGGQACMYNVWSRISRAHLEHLLENMRMVKTAR
jgi:hypothetical protein